MESANVENSQATATIKDQCTIETILEELSDEPKHQRKSLLSSPRKELKQDITIKGVQILLSYLNFNPRKLIRL